MSGFFGRRFLEGRRARPDSSQHARYALGLADNAADNASCTRRHVGAAILTTGDLVAVGHNALPDGVAPSCPDGGCPRGRFTHDVIGGALGNNGHPVPCLAVHAEQRATEAALAARTNPDTALVAITHAPCPPCRELLIDGRWGTVVHHLRNGEGGIGEIVGIGGWWLDDTGGRVEFAQHWPLGAAHAPSQPPGGPPVPPQRS